jgi:bacteriocin-like protein
MKQLSKNEMKKVLGGQLAPQSTCSVQCSTGDFKTRDCGSGSTCSTSGTTISCNSETTGTEMCTTNQ